METITRAFVRSNVLFQQPWVEVAVLVVTEGKQKSIVTQYDSNSDLVTFTLRADGRWVEQNSKYPGAQVLSIDVVKCEAENQAFHDAKNLQDRKDKVGNDLIKAISKHRNYAKEFNLTNEKLVLFESLLAQINQFDAELNAKILL